jgi:hypothetical protein
MGCSHGRQLLNGKRKYNLRQRRARKPQPVEKYLQAEDQLMCSGKLYILHPPNQMREWYKKE